MHKIKRKRERYTIIYVIYITYDNIKEEIFMFCNERWLYFFGMCTQSQRGEKKKFLQYFTKFEC